MTLKMPVPRQETLDQREMNRRRALRAIVPGEGVIDTHAADARLSRPTG